MFENAIGVFQLLIHQRWIRALRLEKAVNQLADPDIPAALKMSGW